MTSCFSPYFPSVQQWILSWKTRFFVSSVVSSRHSTLTALLGKGDSPSAGSRTHCSHQGSGSLRLETLIYSKWGCVSVTLKKKKTQKSKTRCQYPLPGYVLMKKTPFLSMMVTVFWGQGGKERKAEPSPPAAALGGSGCSLWARGLDSTALSCTFPFWGCVTRPGWQKRKQRSLNCFPCLRSALLCDKNLSECVCMLGWGCHPCLWLVQKL